MRNKRFLSKLTVFVMTMMFIVSTPMSENVFAKTIIAGDVDENEKVDLNDAKIALKLAVGIAPGLSISEQGKLNADYDSSGKIDLNDAKYILKKAVGISESTSSNTLTTGQKNALESAKKYLNFMPFSYSGLIKQLEYEKFSHEEAVFAADNCGADWNKQAVKKAKSYLETLSFSKDGLIKQLEFEEFTHEQAVYAVNNCGADWNEQAVKMAKSYLEIFSYSKERLIEQLEFEGFTHEQAVYAAEQNGF